MTTAEAREAIKKEFMDGFYEWLKDEAEMPEEEYGRKYGWGKGAELHKDNFDSVKVYMEYIFAGRYLPGWERAGYSKEIIWELHHDGFLSYKWYQSYQARIRGKSDFYYINQKVARQIYKELKRKAA